MRKRPNKSLFKDTITSGGSSITSPNAFWNLDQASGSNRTDSCSSPADLSVFGTVSQAAGLINNSASVASGNNYLANSGSSKLVTAGTFSACGWFYLNNSAGGNIGNLGGSGIGGGWDLTASTTHLILKTYQSFVANTSLDKTISITTGTWHFVVVYYDSSTLGISLDGGTFTTGAGSAPASESNIFLLNSGDTMTPNSLQGRLDEFGYWVGYKLTSSEVTALYNSGSGKTFNGTSWV